MFCYGVCSKQGLTVLTITAVGNACADAAVVYQSGCIWPNVELIMATTRQRYQK